MTTWYSRCTCRCNYGYVAHTLALQDLGQALRLVSQGVLHLLCVVLHTICSYHHSDVVSFKISIVCPQEIHWENRESREELNLHSRMDFNAEQSSKAHRWRGLKMSTLPLPLTAPPTHHSVWWDSFQWLLPYLWPKTRFTPQHTAGSSVAHVRKTLVMRSVRSVFALLLYCIIFSFVFVCVYPFFFPDVAEIDRSHGFVNKGSLLRNTARHRSLQEAKRSGPT